MAGFEDTLRLTQETGIYCDSWKSLPPPREPKEAPLLGKGGQEKSQEGAAALLSPSAPSLGPSAATEPPRVAGPGHMDNEARPQPRGAEQMVTFPPQHEVSLRGAPESQGQSAGLAPVQQPRPSDGTGPAQARMTDCVK